VSPPERDLGELGGVDPIDAHVPAAEPLPALARLAEPFRMRAALGLEAAPAPALVLVPLGFLLGPHASDILSAAALAHLDVAISVGLAALGVFIGIALGPLRGPERRLLAAASAEALATLGIVGAAVLFLLSRWNLPLDVPAPVVALALGVCAAASSGSASTRLGERIQPLAARIADLDDVLPVAIGGFVLAFLRTHDPYAAAGMTLLTAGVGLGVGLAGWLLFERARSAAERGVFVLGSVVLLGGSAAYMGQSALLAGLAAGLFWRLAPGRSDRIIHDDLRRLQHPLVVLLLLVSGASLQPDRTAVWLLAPLVLFRLLGKLVGGWVAARVVTEPAAPADLGAYLLPPGVIGIAFALAFQQFSDSPVGAAVVTATAATAVASELLAVAALGEPRRA
jgi:hypothetical protein